MSWSESDRIATGSELRHNLERCERSYSDVAAALEFSDERLEATCAMATNANPADVWLLRDYLAVVLADRGIPAVPYTVLTDAARPVAGLWLGLRGSTR